MARYAQAPDRALVDVPMRAFSGDPMALAAKRTICPIYTGVCYSGRSDDELSGRRGAAGYIRKSDDRGGPSR